jgi:hypothetical protein
MDDTLRIETYTLTKLIADEGKVLTNGTEYTTALYLGAYDSVDNWQEVDESEAPQKEEEDD